MAQLGRHLLCKYAVISPKSLNRRLLTVQIPLVVGLLTGQHKRLPQTLRKNGRRELTSDASRSVTSPENTPARTLQRVSGPFSINTLPEAISQSPVAGICQ